MLMFADTRELWKRYTTVMAPRWSSDDPVQDLGAEIRNMLEQLDLVLGYVQRASEAFTSGQREAMLRAGQEAQLFTEIFYLVAWRIVVAIKKAPKTMFPPNGAALDVPGITRGRNLLIEHPEQRGGVYRQSLVFTSAGPVLKGSAVVVRGATGMVEPDRDSGERGLYEDARELHEEIMRIVTGALAATEETTV